MAEPNTTQQDPSDAPSDPAASTEALEQPIAETISDGSEAVALEADTPLASAPKKRLGEQLIDLGLISDDQLQVVLTEQKSTSKLLGNILVEMGFITESVLSEILAESSGTTKFDAKAAMLDSAVVRKLPKEIATRHKVVPIAMQGEDELQLAMADVYNVIAIDQVRRHFPRNVQIKPFFCSESEILELIDQYYDYEVAIDGILREIETGLRDNQQLDGQEEGYLNPTVRLVNSILVDAIKHDTSDIHMEPEGTFLRIRYRIDGQMTQARSLHRDYWAAILVRIKIMSGMNIAETRAPQDGRINFSVSGRDIDFRVATQPTIHGENIVLRLLDRNNSLVPLNQLGYSDHNIDILYKMIKRPEGIIVVTGPTGSGKTTTLYSVLNHINNINVNIMTLEDPVEYQLPLIRQTNVREGIMDFSSGVKSLLRQDPDIIFVGEVRDEDTAIMTVRAALTGHQVFTSLHTNDALGVIPRLGDIGVPAALLSGALIGMVAQRLGRKLCPKCKVEKKADSEDCKILAIDVAKAPTIFEAKGCEACSGKGYKGRLAIGEIIRVDEEMDELIATEAGKRAMHEHITKKGFRSMADDGVEKVLAGVMDIKELVGTIDLTDRL